MIALEAAVLEVVSRGESPARQLRLDAVLVPWVDAEGDVIDEARYLRTPAARRRGAATVADDDLTDVADRERSLSVALVLDRPPHQVRVPR